MRVTIHVKPNAKQVKVEEIGLREYRVAVKSPPVEGKANEAVIETERRELVVFLTAKVAASPGQAGLAPPAVPAAPGLPAAPGMRACTASGGRSARMSRSTPGNRCA